MTGEDVPSSEMQWLSSSQDPIDAVLTGDSLDEDLLDVSALVHDVRAAYLSDDPLRRCPELVAYTGPTAGTEEHLDASGPSGHAVASAPPASAACPDGPSMVAEPTGATNAGGKRAARMLVAFGSTLGGKIAVGTMAMATTLGGLHTAGALDVPILPDRDQVPEEHSKIGDGSGLADDSDAERSESPAPERPSNEDAGSGRRRGQSQAEPPGQGQGPASTTRNAAQEYVQAVQDWNDCVAEAASGPEKQEAGGFNPREACGPKPEPADFGLGEKPDTPQDRADRDTTAGEEGEGAPDQVPASDPGSSGSGDPAGKGSDPPGAGSGNTNGSTGKPASTPGATAPGRLDGGGPPSQAGPASS